MNLKERGLRIYLLQIPFMIYMHSEIFKSLQETLDMGNKTKQLVA